MIHPSLEELPFDGDSEQLFARLRHLPGAVWLDSGQPHSTRGRFDIISALPEITITATSADRAMVADEHGTRTVPGDLFATAWQVLQQQGVAPADHLPVPFAGGLIGYFDYELGRSLHGLPDTPGDGDTPRARLGWYGWAVVVDHQLGRNWLVVHPACDDRALAQVRQSLAATTPNTADSDFALASAFQPEQDREAYRRALMRIKAYIEAGDCYQVNYALRHNATYSGDPWHAYRTLRHALPSPYSAYLDWGGTALLSLSPECFLQVRDGEVETRPIKGTIARGRDSDEDRALARQLLDSEKDRAENLMIVDLLRNDLSRNCGPGSVRVPELFKLESYANVHHLVSTVTGRLAPGRTPLDLLRDAFPGGSITGAPKRRAMEIIAELESRPREIYCGSIGYISACGAMDTSIAIRTLLARDARLYCWGGGGIVADSDPEQEYAEALQKVNVLMRALEADQ